MFTSLFITSSLFWYTNFSTSPNHKTIFPPIFLCFFPLFYIKQMVGNISKIILALTIKSHQSSPDPEVQKLWLRPSHFPPSCPLVSLRLEQLQRSWLMHTQESKHNTTNTSRTTNPSCSNRQDGLFFLSLLCKYSAACLLPERCPHSCLSLPYGSLSVIIPATNWMGGMNREDFTISKRRKFKTGCKNKYIRLSVTNTPKWLVLLVIGF